MNRLVEQPINLLFTSYCELYLPLADPASVQKEWLKLQPEEQSIFSNHLSKFQQEIGQQNNLRDHVRRCTDSLIRYRHLHNSTSQSSNNYHNHQSIPKKIETNNRSGIVINSVSVNKHLSTIHGSLANKPKTPTSSSMPKTPTSSTVPKTPTVQSANLPKTPTSSAMPKTPTVQSANIAKTPSSSTVPKTPTVQSANLPKTPTSTTTIVNVPRTPSANSINLPKTPTVYPAPIVSRATSTSSSTINHLLHNTSSSHLLIPFQDDLMTCLHRKPIDKELSNYMDFFDVMATVLKDQAELANKSKEILKSFCQFNVRNRSCLLCLTPEDVFRIIGPRNSPVVADHKNNKQVQSKIAECLASYQINNNSNRNRNNDLSLMDMKDNQMMSRKIEPFPPVLLTCLMSYTYVPFAVPWLARCWILLCVVRLIDWSDGHNKNNNVVALFQTYSLANQLGKQDNHLDLLLCLNELLNGMLLVLQLIRSELLEYFFSLPPSLQKRVEMEMLSNRISMLQIFNGETAHALRLLFETECSSYPIIGLATPANRKVGKIIKNMSHSGQKKRKKSRSKGKSSNKKQKTTSRHSSKLKTDRRQGHTDFKWSLVEVMTNYVVRIKKTEDDQLPDNLLLVNIDLIRYAVPELNDEKNVSSLSSVKQVVKQIRDHLRTCKQYYEFRYRLPKSTCKDRFAKIPVLSGRPMVKYALAESKVLQILCQKRLEMFPESAALNPLDPLVVFSSTSV